MMNRWSDCKCIDYPCCGCYDTIEPEPEFCDMCGGYHTSQFSCDDDDPDYDDEDTDDEDVIAIRGAREKNSVQKFIDAAREYDFDRPWEDTETEDY